MGSLEKLYQLPIAEFIGELKSVRYGYKDKGGALHFAHEDGFHMTHTQCFAEAIPREMGDEEYLFFVRDAASRQKFSKNYRQFDEIMIY